MGDPLVSPPEKQSLFVSYPVDLPLQYKVVLKVFLPYIPVKVLKTCNLSEEVESDLMSKYCSQTK